MAFGAIKIRNFLSMVKGITIINGQQTLIIPFGIDGFGAVNKLKIILYCYLILYRHKQLERKNFRGFLFKIKMEM